MFVGTAGNTLKVPSDSRTTSEMLTMLPWAS